IPHRTIAVYGQHNMNTEVQALKNDISIVTGTPGRVYDHICQGTLETKNIHFLVLDEADRMLDMGFIDQVKKIIKTLPKDRLTLLFSATIPPEIKRICSYHMKNPVTIEIESDTKTVDTIKQIYYRVNHNEKRTHLNRILLSERPENCMIFCNTRIAVDRVQSFLSEKGYGCQALHGDIPQERRLRTMQQFKNGSFHILVATDVAARGIHIEGLSLVINYDVPNEKDSYIHRIGRTGRAGQDGRAISLVTGDDIMSLYEIEEHIGVLIEESELPTDEQLSEHNENIELWVKANSTNIKPVRTRTGSSSRHGSSRKASDTRTRVSENRDRKSYDKSTKNDKSATQTDVRRNTEHSIRKNIKQPDRAIVGYSAKRAGKPISGLNTKQADIPNSDFSTKQVDKPGFNTKQSAKLPSGFNTSQTSERKSGYGTKQQAERKSGFSAIQQSERKSGFKTKQSDESNSSFSTRQSAERKSGFDNKQQAEHVTGNDLKQTARASSRKSRSTGNATKISPSHPAIIRARAEALKNKTSSFTGSSSNTTGNTGAKKEQSFIKRLANRIFGIK
ncbi:MAG: DEAD/DEAH box helicase, partial [Eubacteriales bacterium]|nr:DEAD/DEAH box helicase [Eubacteriales bacterium]